MEQGNKTPYARRLISRARHPQLFVIDSAGSSLSWSVSELGRRLIGNSPPTNHWHEEEFAKPSRVRPNSPVKTFVTRTRLYLHYSVLVTAVARRLSKQPRWSMNEHSKF